MASHCPEVLLLQMGYLTILESYGEVMKLGCPNEGMYQSMARLYVEMMLGDDAESYAKARSLARTLLTESFFDFVKTLNAVFSGLLSHGWSIQCEADARYAVQMLLAAAGLRVRCDVWGRSAQVLDVEVGRLCWLFDVKLVAKRQLVGFRQGLQALRYDEVPAALIDQTTHADLVFLEDKQRFIGKIIIVATTEKAPKKASS